METSFNAQSHILFLVDPQFFPSRYPIIDYYNLYLKTTTPKDHGPWHPTAHKPRKHSVNLIIWGELDVMLLGKFLCGLYHYKTSFFSFVGDSKSLYWKFRDSTCAEASIHELELEWEILERCPSMLVGCTTFMTLVKHMGLLAPWYWIHSIWFIQSSCQRWRVPMVGNLPNLSKSFFSLPQISHP